MQRSNSEPARPESEYSSKRDIQTARKSAARPGVVWSTAMKTDSLAHAGDFGKSSKKARQVPAQVNNAMCSICSKAAPVLYCTCLGEMSYLCNTCLSAHTLKYPQLPHPMVPVAVDSVDFSTYDRRSRGFAEGKGEFQRNLEAIDSCCRELSAAVETLIVRLNQYRDEWIQQLCTWKSQLQQEFDEAVAEVERTLLEERPALNCQYASELRDYQPGRLLVFNYQIHLNSTQAKIESLLKASCSGPKDTRKRKRKREVPGYDSVLKRFRMKGAGPLSEEDDVPSWW